MSDERREAQRQGGLASVQNLSTASALRSRESWKYADVRTYLTDLGIEHEFEFQIGHFIYDLALLSRKILIEFDGPDHEYLAEEDRRKEISAS